MRQKSFIPVAVLLLVLAGGAVAAYAYDSSREDLIAEGVTVAGIDVGGMSTEDARLLIQRRLQEPLEQPIAVRQGQTALQPLGRGRRCAGRRRRHGRRGDRGQPQRQHLQPRGPRSHRWGRGRPGIRPRDLLTRPPCDELVARVQKSAQPPGSGREVDFPSLEKVKEQHGNRGQDGSCSKSGSPRR